MVVPTLLYTHFFLSAVFPVPIRPPSSTLYTGIHSLRGPTFYTLLEDVITVDIDTKYTPGVQVGSLTATATVDGYSATMEAMGDSGNALVPLTVLNTRGFDLPETGGKGTMVTTVVDIVLASGMLTGCIALRYWKRKGELDEKK